MTDPIDGLDPRLDPRLAERMERAVGGLQAPDVLGGALTRGRRQRARRRVVQGAGGIAAVTALALAVPAFADRGPGPDSRDGFAAVDPTSLASVSAQTSAPNPCGESATGWWSKSSDQIAADLAALLPDGVRIGTSSGQSTGSWSGTLVADGDTDAASLTLLPPPGVPGGRRTLQELADGGPCEGGSNAPLQPVEPCQDVAGATGCAEIRSADGTLIGVVVEKVEMAVVAGQDQPTDRAYLLATLASSDGGHVEFTVAEGTGAGPDDQPALTTGQMRAILTDAVWTS